MAWVSLAAILISGTILALFLGLIPTYAQICEIDERKHESCPYYNIALFSLIKITKFFDEHGGALTAVATIAIAWFTLSLRDATAEQGRLTQQSIDLTRAEFELARAEFIASHRPQLKIHFVRIVSGGRMRRPIVDQPIRVKFEIINIGTSEATVLKSAVYLAYSTQFDLPSLPDVPRNDVIEPDRRFYEGMSGTCEVSSDPWRADQHGGLLYLYGWIAYRDAMDNPRTTYFCPYQADAIGSFPPVDDPDCEQTY
jgi:hypothetical protein